MRNQLYSIWSALQAQQIETDARMAAQRPPNRPPPPLQIPPRPIFPPLNPPHAPRPLAPSSPPSTLPPDGKLGMQIDPGWFKVIIMRCTEGVHEGAASVTLDHWQGKWKVLPVEFMESVLTATASLPVQHLILKQHQLTNIPSNFSHYEYLLCNSLTTLDLCHNCLASLPPVVCELVQLKKLFLGSNSISELPPQLSKLKQLEILNLQYNKLRALSVQLCNLQSLKCLNIEENEIESVVPEICQLTRLKELHLQGNKIRSLPDSLNQLSTLEELHLANNLLKHLPFYMEGMTSLKQLHLAGNKLRFLPPTVVHLHHLQGLTLTGNKLKFPPLHACRRGVDSMKAYMKREMESCSREWSSPDGSLHTCVTENPYYNSDSESEGDAPYEELDTPALLPRGRSFSV